MRLTKILSALAAICLCVSASAQQYRFISEDYQFVDYLLGNTMSKDAVAYLEGMPFNSSDTLSFLKGKAYYYSQNLDLASRVFSEIPATSSFYEKAVFFGVVADTYIGDFSNGIKRLNNYNGNHNELKAFELAGLALLCNDKQAYLDASSKFTHSIYALSEGEDLFGQIYQSRFEQKQKSPALAAAMSAIIPGAGKFYAGRADEGIASFLSVAIFAGFTAENWVKCGATNWKTITFGALSSLFYIGNIYGSYFSVGLYNDELRNAQNATITYHMHLPVRSLFD